MRRTDLDPFDGVFTWARTEAARRRATFAWGVGVIGLVSIVVTAGLAPPDGSSVGVRVGNGIAGLVATALIVIALSVMYALVRAPYQQRDELRRRIVDLEERNTPAEVLTSLGVLLTAGEDLLGVLGQLAWQVEYPIGGDFDAMVAWQRAFESTLNEIEQWHQNLDAVLLADAGPHDVALSRAGAAALQRQPPDGMQSHHYTWDQLARRLQWLSGRMDELRRT